ncbi:hypothetical protein F7O66_11685 [Neisseria meningitidis]|nr:hypothetical protein [Neisseria meningitidis]
MPTDLDSRLRGNDGGAVSVFSGKYPQAKILLFSQKQKTKNSNLKFVIPAQAGIQCVEFQLFRINFETFPVIPTKVGIQDAKSQETVLPDKFPHRQT